MTANNPAPSTRSAVGTPRSIKASRGIAVYDGTA